jgi:hypothetical protein
VLLILLQHIFENHALKAGSKEHILSHAYSFPMFFILLTATLIIVYLRAMEWKLFSKILVAMVNMKVTKQLEREDYTPTRRVSLLLLAHYAIVMSAFVYRFTQQFLIHFEKNENALYVLLIPLILVSLHGTKMIINYMIGLLSKEESTLYAFNFNLILMLKASGLILLPIILLYEFSTINKIYLLYAGASVVIYFFLARYWRLLIISINRPQLAVFHIILYFCALELIPILFIKTFLFRY